MTIYLILNLLSYWLLFLSPWGCRLDWWLRFALLSRLFRSICILWFPLPAHQNTSTKTSSAHYQKPNCANQQMERCTVPGSDALVLLWRRSIDAVKLEVEPTSVADWFSGVVPPPQSRCVRAVKMWPYITREDFSIEREGFLFKKKFFFQLKGKNIQLKEKIIQRIQTCSWRNSFQFSCCQWEEEQFRTLTSKVANPDLRLSSMSNQAADSSCCSWHTSRRAGRRSCCSTSTGDLRRGRRHMWDTRRQWLERTDHSSILGRTVDTCRRENVNGEKVYVVKTLARMFGQKQWAQRGVERIQGWQLLKEHSGWNLPRFLGGRSMFCKRTLR